MSRNDPERMAHPMTHHECMKTSTAPRACLAGSGRWVLGTLLFLAGLTAGRAELRIPAFTAYLDPDVNGARALLAFRHHRLAGSKGEGAVVRGTQDAGRARRCTLALRLPPEPNPNSGLRWGAISRDVTVAGQGTNHVLVDFEAFPIATAGYQCFALESLNPEGAPAGDLEALLLDGPAARDAHFNLKERRNAASVHLDLSRCLKAPTSRRSTAR